MDLIKNYRAIKLQDKIARMTEDARPKLPKQEPIYQDIQKIVNKMIWK